MLTFRIICALLVAWAMNWAVSHPEAGLLREELPEFAPLAPLAGAIVGFHNLARRQGWGTIVAVANGLWAGFLSLILTSAMFVAVKVAQSAAVGGFDTAFIFGLIAVNTADVVDGLSSAGLMVVILGATTIVGIVTEIVHWALVRLREQRGIKPRNTRRAHRPSMY